MRSACSRRRRVQRAWVLQGACLGLFGVGAWYAPAVAPKRLVPQRPLKTIDYNRDVRPIITKCFTCHGHDPKQIQAGLRLDLRDGATKKLADGLFAIVPGHPEKSELVKRVFATDDAIMPPKSSNKILSAEDKTTLRRWISEGAEYKEHWAFIKPVRPALPAVKETTWPRNPIDRFILAKVEERGLKPSPEADKRTLIRRVTLDLTGLPPTSQEVAAYLADHSKNAYEKVVDRLLASPRYGERMAMDWLDYARYADSNGYQADFERYQWRWRDWVIDAFNRNMPYDKFTIDQLAGDLEPNATMDQKIATGFNRNHRINTEGGVVPEEWRIETVIDRVETTSETWLGLTAGCARCHDHKYDPLSQKEFYSLFAYFNNVPETGSGVEQPVNHPPLMQAPTVEQQARLAAFKSQEDELDGQVKAQLVAHRNESDQLTTESGFAAKPDVDGMVARYRLGETIGVTAGNAAAPKVVGPLTFPKGRSTGAVATNDKAYVELGNVGDFDTKDAFSYGAWIFPESPGGSPFSRMDSMHDFRGYDLFLEGDRPAVHIISKWPMDALKVISKTPIPMDAWSHVFATYDGSAKPSGIKIYVNGLPVATDVAQEPLHGSIRSTVTARIGRRTDDSIFRGRVDDLTIYDRAVPADQVQQFVERSGAAQILATAPAARTPEQKDELTRILLDERDPAFRDLNNKASKVIRDRNELDSQITTVMVMEEMPKPRPAFVLIRGQYDHPGAAVTASLPSILQIKGKTFPNNRLGLAEWIVDPENPLTARVTVNRLWERFFGAGIVPTVEDFGTRADFPSHPELLDWLATEFIGPASNGRKWDLKNIIREMVTSATYRQSSEISPDRMKADPTNRLLARGPRFRLTAEVIRDQAMYVGGLLTEKIGGPSVRPYQPAGVWDDVNVYGNLRNYKHDMGPDLHRRSLYTIWKRTAAPPNMTLFDMPSRETCRVQRARTDTPLQALTLLNDVTYVEAARALGQRMLLEGGAGPDARLRFAFETVLSRDPSNDESRILKSHLEENLAHYRADPADAKKLIAEGDLRDNPKLAVPDVAAYTILASMILNLDETINKE